MTFSVHNIKSLLENAILKNQIKTFYQPKFDSIFSTVVGAEALSRWMDDDGKIISPQEFIPLLEETELITQLDWYILEQACLFQRKMLDSNFPVVVISVNFSRVHTKEKDFVPRLKSILEKYNITHDLIEIEITESALVYNRDVIIDFITGIREAGFDVSIDDFGSGLSSLSFLKDVPANILKIDKSLISQNCENQKERIVLESIFDFAHRLNMKTVAEGVETKEQLGFLKTCDCTMIQGFLFSKPLEEEIFEELLLTADTDKNKYQTDFSGQFPKKATYLLQDIIYKRYFHIAMLNISRDSFYLMSRLDVSIMHGANSGSIIEFLNNISLIIHPQDKENFVNTFSPKNHEKAYREKKNYISLKFKIRSRDGNFHNAETRSYFVEDPNIKDIITIALTELLD